MPGERRPPAAPDRAKGAVGNGEKAEVYCRATAAVVELAARGHCCPVGVPARRWAARHDAGPELPDERGPPGVRAEPDDERRSAGVHDWSKAAEADEASRVDERGPAGVPEANERGPAGVPVEHEDAGLAAGRPAEVVREQGRAGEHSRAGVPAEHEAWAAQREATPLKQQRNGTRICGAPQWAAFTAAIPPSVGNATVRSAEEAAVPPDKNESTIPTVGATAWAAEEEAIPPKTSTHQYTNYFPRYAQLQESPVTLHCAQECVGNQQASTKLVMA